MSDLVYLRASILYFTQDPYHLKNQEEACKFYQDGLIILNEETGLVVDSGDYESLVESHKIDKSKINEEFKDKLIMPGFIDCHTHYPQTEMMLAYSQSLLQWLNEYTFPTEKQFGDYEYAREISKFYLNQLLKNGTTSALVFSTVHKQSVEAIFDEALKLNMRIISGKTLMDRNAPEYLLDTPELALKESEELIEKYSNKGRLLYSVTPRFAPTSTQAQLDVVGELKRKYPEVWIHTHLNENIQEIEWVQALFPESKSYLHVYKDSNMLHKKSVFAHCCHCTQDDFDELKGSQSGVAFCPSSNGFLGAGIFDYHMNVKNDINFGIGTDIGAGTDFSILKTLQDGYKFTMLKQQNTGDRRPMSSFEGLYRATLGGAKALSIDDKVGKFEKGYEADFVVLDWSVGDIQKLRTSCLNKTQSSMYAKNGDGGEFKLQEKLFGVMMLGGEKNVCATYVAGIEQYRQRSEKI